MEYEIMTHLSVFDPKRDWDDDSYAERLYDNQQEVLDKLGYCWSDSCLLKYKGKYCIADINDAIESLAIKDGINLVRFSNGHIGFVAYYNGFRVEDNSFEIICPYDKIRILYGNMLSWEDASLRCDGLDPKSRIDRDIYIEELVWEMNRLKENA